MAKISTYPVVPAQPSDIIVGTDASDSNNTKNFSVQSIIDNVPLPTPGWNRFDDSAYTSGSPFLVNDGTKVDLPNNGNLFQDSVGPDVFYDTSSNKLVGINKNDTYILTIAFIASATNANNGYLDVTMSGPAGYNRIADTVTFPKGNGEIHPIHLVWQYYADADFVANGAKIEVGATGTDVQIYDIIYFIQRVYNAQ